MADLSSHYKAPRCPWYSGFKLFIHNASMAKLCCTTFCNSSSSYHDTSYVLIGINSFSITEHLEFFENFLNNLRRRMTIIKSNIVESLNIHNFNRSMVVVTIFMNKTSICSPLEDPDHTALSKLLLG